VSLFAAKDRTFKTARPNQGTASGACGHATMTGAQLAAVSFLARYSGRTHSLYAYQLRE